MSGSLFGQVAGSIIDQLFGGSDGGVQLGGVTFGGVEVPQVIRWGGKLEIIKHKMPGGVKIFNSTGLDFPPIGWSGIFDGSDAITRSRQLYTMMNAADLISLSWNDRSYTVLISSYEAHDTKTNWIPYSIVCEVLRDETLSSAPSAPSALAQVSADISGSISSIGAAASDWVNSGAIELSGDLSDLTGIDPNAIYAGVSGALAVAQTAAVVAGAVVTGTAANLALNVAADGVADVVDTGLDLANDAVGSVIDAAAATGSVVLAAGTAALGVGALVAANAAVGVLANLPIVNGRFGRVQVNLANAST